MNSKSQSYELFGVKNTMSFEEVIEVMVSRGLSCNRPINTGSASVLIKIFGPRTECWDRSSNKLHVVVEDGGFIIFTCSIIKSCDPSYSRDYVWNQLITNNIISGTKWNSSRYCETWYEKDYTLDSRICVSMSYVDSWIVFTDFPEPATPTIIFNRRSDVLENENLDLKKVRPLNFN